MVTPRRKERSASFEVGGRLFDGTRTVLMGVLNCTPDSFSDGGRFLSSNAAVEQGQRLAGEGAEILDVGGESTRPGAAAVPAAEQIQRVCPVIERLRATTEAVISVDTTSSVVARAAIGAGAVMVNDVSAMTFDPDMASTVADAEVSLCLMHIQGRPQSMQEDPRYGDVLREVTGWLQERLAAATDAGIVADRICVDPGIGFGKKLEHNLALIAGVGALGANLARPVLIGPSRKSFLGLLTGKPTNEREFATAAAVCASVLHGATILRVHDVAAMRDVVRVADALRMDDR